MEPLEILMIGVGLLLFLLVAMIWIIRSSIRAKCEARWALPSFRSKHLHIETEPGKLRVKVSGVTGIQRYHYGRQCDPQDVPEAGSDMEFADEAMTEPHTVSFFADSTTQNHHYEATPDRFRGTIYGSGSGAFVSGEIIPGTRSFDIPVQVANGRVQITFREFHDRGPKSQTLTDYMFDLGMEEACNLLQWVLRHPSHVKEHTYGAPNSPLEKVRLAFVR